MLKILSIGGGKEQADGINIARELGFYVITIDSDPDCIGSKISDEFHAIDIKDSHIVIDFARSKKVMGVVPNPIGRYLTTVGMVNDALSFTGAGYLAAQTVTDKSKFHRFAINNQIPVPEQVEVYDLNIDTLPFDYPAILKPKHGSGSRGIKVVLNEDELHDAIVECKHHYQDGLLVERFEEGEVYGADVIVMNGIPDIVCIRIKMLTPLPYRVEYAYFTMDNPHLKKRLNELLINVVRGLNVTNCLMHVDFVLNKNNKLFIIELSLRPAGLTLTTRLVPLSTGRNLIREFLVFMKGDFKPSVGKYQAAALWFTAVSGEEELCIPDSSEIEKVEGVVNYQEPRELYHTDQIRSMADLLSCGSLLFKASDDKACLNLYNLLKDKFIRH